MKIIGRTLAILAAALLVCGAAYALAQSGGTASDFREGGGFARSQPGQQEGRSSFGQDGFRGSDRGRFPGEFGRERGMSLFGIGEVVKNLAIIAVIIAIGAPIAGLLRKRRPDKPTRPHSPPAASQ